jgi:hypothetical protein
MQYCEFSIALYGQHLNGDNSILVCILFFLLRRARLQRRGNLICAVFACEMNEHQNVIYWKEGELNIMSFTELLLAIGVVSFIIFASFHIFYIIEVRKTSLATRQLITRAEENLHPALAAVRHIFEDIKTIADNAAVLSKSLREAAEALAIAQNAIKNIYRSYEDKLDKPVRANMSGLKAGIKTGVVTLLSNLKDKKEGLS